MGATADAAKATSASSPSAVVVGVSWETPRPYFRCSISFANIDIWHEFLMCLSVSMAHSDLHDSQSM